MIAYDKVIAAMDSYAAAQVAEKDDEIAALKLSNKLSSSGWRKDCEERDELIHKLANEIVEKDAQIADVKDQRDHFEKLVHRYMSQATQSATNWDELEVEIAQLIDANADLQSHSARMETTYAATVEMLRMGNEHLLAEIKRLMEGIDLARERTNGINQEIQPISDALFVLLCDSPTPVTESKPLVCHEMTEEETEEAAEIIRRAWEGVPEYPCKMCDAEVFPAIDGGGAAIGGESEALQAAIMALHTLAGEFPTPMWKSREDYLQATISEINEILGKK